MGIFVVGTSHRSAGARARECIHVPLGQVHETMARLRSGKGVVLEAVPLHTCGRLELYGVARDADRALRLLTRLAGRSNGVPRAELERHGYVHRDGGAIRHLFAVASGLDSAIQGEGQILGQVRQAAHDPLARRSTGPVLDRLFQHALRTGKRVRATTDIGRGAASLASASVGLLAAEVDELRSLSILIVGAGDTGTLMGRLLAKSGVSRIAIANRTGWKAERVAREIGAEPLSLSGIGSTLSDYDIVIGAAASPEPIVTAGSVEALPPEHRPRLFLDLAHPGCLEMGLDEISGVSRIDLEHVFQRVESAREARSAHLLRAWEIVEEEASAFETWQRSRDSAAVVKAVRRRALERAMTEAQRLTSGASEEEREHIRRLARSVARAILHQPTVALRDVDASSDQGRAFLEHASALFGVELPPEVKDSP